MDIDRGTVEAVARRAVGDPAATLLEWSSVELGAGASAELGKSGGLRRVMGTVAVERGEQPWSAIAKTLRDHEIEVGDAHPDVNDPHGIEYWRREVEAYESGVLDDLDDGIGAPRRYHIEDLDREAIVWMEDVPDEHHAGWPLDRYWMAARDLGVFNGRFAGAVPAAARTWASQGRLVDWVRDAASGIELMQHGREREFMRTWLSDDSVERIARLYATRETMLRLLEPLPETLCHHDAHRRNLISRRDEGRQRTVAVDWAMSGTGHLGEDLAVLTGVSLQFMDVPMTDRVEFEAAVMDGYVTGLRVAGWTGSEARLRLGYKAALSLFLGVAAAGLWYSGLDLAGNEDFVEHVIGHPPAEVAAQWAELQPYLLDLGEEALLVV